MQGMADKPPTKQAGTGKPTTAGRVTGTGEKKTQAARGGLMGKLQAMPQAAGIAALVLLCALALPVGNLRALQNATPKAFLRQGDVRSIVADRASAAGNAVTTAERAGNVDEQTRAVETAAQALRDAKTAREISRADQALQLAVSQMADAAQGALDSEGQTMLQRALDDFTEQGNFLRQEARAYNQEAEKAQKVYDGLPLRALFDEPDRYEGL